MNQEDIPALLSRLSSDEDAVRKMAVFKLQSSINDPSFADTFISAGGLNIMRRLIMATGGNTLAYSLQSLSRLLEVDMGWEIFEEHGAGELVERIVELIVTHPLVNILRGAMSILVAIVSHPQSSRGDIKIPSNFGFRALKPAIAVYPQFFEMVVSQLNSADHALCANALMLLNALMRDAISDPSKSDCSKVTGTGEEWPKFIKRLQDLGVIKAAYMLMQSSALQDLAHPLLEFQALTKVLLMKWREVRVDLEKLDHRRALKGLHLTSAPERKEQLSNGASRAEELSENGRNGSKRHHPEKWRRLGFETESPAWEFDETGFLGMMDITDYVRKYEDGFQKLLLEQASQPLTERCPFARVSLAITMILYNHFEVDKSDAEDLRNYLVLDGMKNYDMIFKPLLLQWSRLHGTILQAFFRLWKATGATQDDFEKVAQLVRILVKEVVGKAPRTKDVAEVEEELREFDYHRLREMQMDLLELEFEEQWGNHLGDVRNELQNEAIHFVKEQRVRCLLQGAWFPKSVFYKTDTTDDKYSKGPTSTACWRFAKLSHNRRYLHYKDFESRKAKDPILDDLSEKIDLETVSSVMSNLQVGINGDEIVSNESVSTLRSRSQSRTKKDSTTKITISGYLPDEGDSPEMARKTQIERPILTLIPMSRSIASEWVDALLLLLNQTPLMGETTKMLSLISDYGMKIRLLNVRLDDGSGGLPEGAGVVPSRDGVDEEFYYRV